MSESRIKWITQITRIIDESPYSAGLNRENPQSILVTIHFVDVTVFDSTRWLYRISIDIILEGK